MEAGDLSGPNGERARHDAKEADQPVEDAHGAASVVTISGAHHGELITLVGQDLTGAGGTEHVAHLEHPHRRVAVVGVVAEHAKQPGQQTRPHDRLLRRHRVRHPDDLGAMPGPGEIVVGQERRCPHFAGSIGREQIADAAAVHLLRTESPDEIGPELSAFDVVVAEVSADLFDHVDLGRGIGTPRRNDDIVMARLRARRREPDRSKKSGDRVVTQRSAEHQVDAIRTYTYGVMDRSNRADVVERLDCCSGAGEADDLDEPRRRRGDRLRIGSPFEPGRRLASKVEALGRAGDAHRRPVRDLEEQVGRGVGDLAGEPAHHGGDADGRVAAVGDHAIASLGAEHAFDTVEGGEAFSLGGPADADSPTDESVEIKRMARDAELQHHQVRRIDQVGDGAHPGEGETRLHPPW